MPPRIDIDLPEDADKAWEEGLSNDIIILGKRYKLPTRGGTANRVRNYLDDPSLSLLRSGQKKGYPIDLSRPRPKSPKSMEDLKKGIEYCVIHTAISRHARQALFHLVGAQTGTHFCINWNGVIYQYADVSDRVPHAAGHNDKSVGIDLTLKIYNTLRAGNAEKARNFKKLRSQYETLAKLKLREQGIPEEKIPLLLDDYRFENPKAGTVHGHTVECWGYTRKQYESLILLLKVLYRELELEKTYPMTVDGKVFDTVAEGEDAQKLKGLVGHWHLSNNRMDPGPAFNFERVLAAIQNEYNSLPVVYRDEHSLESLRGDVEKVRKVAYSMIRDNETARQGGTYPVGPNQSWHGGIHLFPPPQDNKPADKRVRYPVISMFEGVLVAAHFEPSARALGHNNFVLLRHELEVPKPGGRLNDDGTPQVTKLKFFSLYMHLAPMTVTRGNADKLAAKGVDWVLRMHDLWGSGADTAKINRSHAEAVAAKRREAEARWDLGKDLDTEMEALLKYSGSLLDAKLKQEVPEFLTKGDGINALSRPGKVAVLVDDDHELRVAAGEILGFVGELNDDSGERVPTLHVEVFGTRETMDAIDLDLHAAHFRVPQRDRTQSLNVNTADMLRVFRGLSKKTVDRRTFLWPEKRLVPAEIKDFYAARVNSLNDSLERSREQLRRSITYHVSEWSDQVDWVSSLLGDLTLNDNDFKKMVKAKGLFAGEIRKFLPFVWLTEDVATAVGLAEDTWNGRLYHFHPIHFLMWVSFYATRRRRLFRTNKREAQYRKGRAFRKVLTRLVKKGQKARAKGGEAWLKFQARLSRRLGQWPFNYTKKKLKDPAQKEMYDELLGDILARITNDEDKIHGVMDDVDPAFSNPGEVLQDLFDLKPHFEWRIKKKD